MGSDGNEEGIEGVDLGCGLTRVQVRVGMNYFKTNLLHCRGPLLE